MTTTTNTPSSPTKSRSSAAGIAGVLLVIAVVAGWAFFNRVPRAASASDFLEDPGPRRGWGGNGAGFAPRPREPVTVMPSFVTINDGEVYINALMSTGSWNISVLFNGQPLADRGGRSLRSAISRIQSMKTPPVRYKLTSEQVAALKAIPTTPPEMSADQIKEMTDLLIRSQSLAATSPELVGIKKSLQDIAKQLQGIDKEAAKAAYAERDAKLRSILSPEQIELILGNRNGNLPTNPQTNPPMNPPMNPQGNPPANAPK